MAYDVPIATRDLTTGVHPVAVNSLDLSFVKRNAEGIKPRMVAFSRLQRFKNERTGWLEREESSSRSPDRTEYLTLLGKTASRYAVMLTSASEEIRSFPPSTFSAKVRTEPSSAPTAIPVSSEMTQLCSGQVT
ncbi:MAG: hypothetical protein K0R53_3137 [Burkholderiales bacterium]|nr:hypothetical protein [Burkholderiales bacterium]